MFEVGEKYPVESSSSSNDIESRGVQPITSLKDNKSIGMIEKDNDDLSCEQYSTCDEVKRDLKARHVSMIAIGGTIGTGLFISTGSLLHTTGPVMSLISFLFVTTLAYSVTQSLGEMTTYIPVSGSFAQFITRWVSKVVVLLMVGYIGFHGP